MSSRFHNKYHRHNHHTSSTTDPRYPDAGHDPIASPDSPFLGPFVMLGTLSATAYTPYSQLSSVPGAVITGDTGIIVTGLSGTAIQATGNINTNGDIVTTGGSVKGVIEFTGNILNLYTSPVTATGEFLEVLVQGVPRAIRLWQTTTSNA